MNLLRFLRKKKSKPMNESERLIAELARVRRQEVDASEPFSYSIQEKEQMYAARQNLRFIPPVGKNGGVIQSIARELGVSRQYVHQIFYPKNPDKLFSGRASMQKRAWQLLAKKVEEHPMLPRYKEVFENLLAGKTVEVTISKSKFQWIKRRGSELVPTLKITASDTTVPTTYTLVP